MLFFQNCYFIFRLCPKERQIVIQSAIGDCEGFWSSKEECSTKKNTEEEDNITDISISSDEDQIVLV